MAVSKLVRFGIDSGELYKFYHIEKWNFWKMAKYYGVQRHSIGRWIRMLGFPLRHKGWHMFGNSLNKGRIFSKEWGINIGKGHKGLPSPLKGKQLSSEHKAKVIKTLINGERAKGKNNPSWKGGIAKLENLCKQYLYKVWIYPILKRDNFTCQVCGDDTGGNLIVHHNKRAFSEIRDKVLNENKHLDIQCYVDKMKLVKNIVAEHKLDDGITLCSLCHCKRHNRNVTAGKKEGNRMPLYKKGETPIRKLNCSKDELSHLYYEKGKTLKEIGDIYDVTRERVRQVMERYNLPRRSVGFYNSSS